MIIKGKSRAGPHGLAAHLGNAELNERVQLLETRGTVADDLRGALLEMDAYGLGTRCEKPLYHAAMSPAPPHRLSPEQRIEAVDALEEKLGLVGHARVVVLHEKLGREHLHVVWSRIDLDEMRSISDSHNYRKHEEVARELERRFGHERVQGAHAERDGVERPDRTPSRSDLRQEDRTGIKGKDVKAEVTAAFQTSDGAEAFRAALTDAGYTLARGDRRDFVIIDRMGGIHSLARRLDGLKAADVREFMAPIDPSLIPTIAEVRNPILEEQKARREAEADTALGRAYASGEDYVSQTRAALKEHAERQRALERENRRDPLWDRLDAGEAEREKSAPSSVDGYEITPEKQARLDQLPNADKGAQSEAPDRQPGAPGGGRTRSR